MNNKVYFGECPICRQGQLLVVKDIDFRIFLMCDDCESQWGSPEAAKSYKNVLKEEIREIVDADEEDVINANWIVPNNP
jgi:hypothetical protein